MKQEQARIALQVQDIVVSGRGKNPYPDMAPGYDPSPLLARLREEVVHVLNQDRRSPMIPAQAGETTPVVPDAIDEDEGLTPSI
ncbi:hypothetical protein AB0G85_36985 [Streptomyces sioyaensis]|uniref:hypothetical protein n=1 Tax=Streptomyces sioyaensis TaxID=67364 RepID=UPI0033F90F0E